MSSRRRRPAWVFSVATWAARRVRPWLTARLATVLPVDVGRVGDGLSRVSSGTELDKPWEELSQEFADALEAWRKNPLARRLVSLITAYVVGEGIELGSDYAPLRRFIHEFTEHPQNRIKMRQSAWCDELGRSGELFLVLHTNAADGMSYVRAMPAASIDQVEWRPGDYEAETRYHERVGMGDPDWPEGRWWWGFGAGEAGDVEGDGSIWSVTLHFAVNRPVGCVRGESDLAPVLSWLRRYSRWLEDRVRLNAAVRAFLWIVKVPGHLVAQKQGEYARPPEAGSVLVVDKGAEDWQAVAPDLNANDAQADGRAIRWMVVAGGPGIGLVDLGEAETSNLATASAMGEQRWRIMRQRQGYLGFVLAQLTVCAYNRAVKYGRLQGKILATDAIEIGLPDISAADNSQLAMAAQGASQALATLQNIGVAGGLFQKLALNMVLRFAGESIRPEDLQAIIEESAAVAAERARVEAEKAEAAKAEREAARQAAPAPAQKPGGEKPAEKAK